MADAPLAGWKEIAAFLGSSVSTAQRFERQLGLPVHRTQSSKGAVVRAYPSELTKWLQERPAVVAAPAPTLEGQPSHDQARSIWPKDGKRRRFGASAAVVLLLLVVGQWAWRSTGRLTPTPSKDAVATRNSLKAATTTGEPAQRVLLTIRPGDGPTLRIGGPEGGRFDLSLAGGLELVLRPAIHGRNLVLDIDRRSPKGSQAEAVGSVRLVSGVMERLDVDGVGLEFTWNAAQPPGGG